MPTDAHDRDRRSSATTACATTATTRTGDVMTSVGQVQRLTAEERTLLREVIRWARAEGWRREHLCEEASRYGKSFYRDWHWHGEQDRVFVERTTFKHNADDWRLVGATPHGGVEHHVDGVMDLRRAVDVLAALGVLPAKFSTAFNAGRESAFDGCQVEWGVQVAANRALAHRGLDEAEAREKLAYYQAIWDEKAWQVKRRLTAWEDVPNAS